MSTGLVVTTRPMVERPSLMQVMAARFERRATVIVAGPGFGKTSLLAQAYVENVDRPRGADLWLSCQPSDESASLLGLRLCTLLSVPENVERDAGETVRALADAIWTRAPLPVALMLDDLHHVPAGSPAAELLASLLTVLPANGHLVMASRAQPPVPLARLTALGQVAWLDEDHLRFSEEELADFAQLRSVRPEALSATAGWPALAELAALGDRAPRRGSRVADFLWEEVLASLATERRRDLALLAGLGHLDPEMAAAAAGHEVDLEELMDGLPLIESAGDRPRMHALWEAALASSASPDERAAARDRVSDLLRRRGDLVEAMRLVGRSGRWASIQPVVRAVFLGGPRPMMVPHDVLATWLDLVPEAHRGEPEAMLLDAEMSVDRSPESAGARFRAAVAAFRDRDDRLGELAALTHWSTLSFRQGDGATYAEQIARTMELAEAGLQLAEDQVRLGRATVGYLTGDWRGILATLEPLNELGLPYEMRSAAWLLRAQALLALGDIPEAARAADLAVELAGPMRTVPGKTRVVTVALTRPWSDALAAVAELMEDTRAARWRNSVAGAYALCALYDARSGDVEALRANLGSAEAFGPQLTDRTADVMIGHARVYRALLEGDEPRAAALMRAELAERPLGAPNVHLPQLTNLPLSYVLVPEARPSWDGAELADFWQVPRSLARALVAIRERGEASAAEALGPLSPDELRVHLPAPWAVELIVAGTHAAADARRLVEELGPTAATWAGPLAASPAAALAGRARRLLAQVSRPAPREIAISVLGPTGLVRGGEPVAGDANWRRPKVQALLLYLVVNPNPRRDEVIDALWPAMDAEAGRRNLRFTLTCLQRVLEPGRPAGEAPFFLRPEGDRLRLTGGELLEVDAWTLRRRLDEADRAASPAAALEAWLAVLPLRRGPFLADLPYAEWALPAREELEGRFVAAAARAGELLARSDPARALDLAGRALDVDRYCERAYRAAAAAHHERGDGAEARRVLARGRAALRELGAEPDDETLTLERALGEPSFGSPSRTTRTSARS